MSRFEKTTTADDPLILRLLQLVTQLDPDRIRKLYDDPMHDSDSQQDSLEQRVIQCGVADENQIAQAYAQYYLVPFFDPPQETPPPVNPTVAAILPPEFCRQHRVAPLSDDGQTAEIAVVSPDSLLLADEVKQTTGRQMRPLFTSLTVMGRLLETLYPCDGLDEPLDAPEPGHHAAPVDQPLAPAPTADNLAPSQDDAAADYVSRLLERAIDSQASDIHIEPAGQHCRVRLRVRGWLTEIDPPPTDLLQPVLLHLKTLANMKNGGDGFTQQGTVQVRCKGRRCDVSVHASRSVSGEKIFMRMLGIGAYPRSLQALGLDDRQQSDLTRTLRSLGRTITKKDGDPAGGMILVTGPQASGKRTTLYSLLQHYNDDQTSICTVEEVVKCKLPLVHQVQVEPIAGPSINQAVRSSLRQDPDVMMVDCVDDRETLELCLQAAIFGKTVMSSFYAHDAIAAMTRMLGMGVPPDDLASTVKMLIAQRRVRRLCDDCKQPVGGKPANRKPVGHDLGPGLFQPAGCHRCRHTGYSGQEVIFEVVPLSRAFFDVMRGAGTIRDADQAMRGFVASQGIKSLSQSVAEKVVRGCVDSGQANRMRFPAV